MRSGRYPALVRLAVGDMVVYASHGAGHVAARERRVVLGKRQEVIVLALAGGLSVELPMERAHELLRPRLRLAAPPHSRSREGSTNPVEDDLERCTKCSPDAGPVRGPSSCAACGVG